MFLLTNQYNHILYECRHLKQMFNLLVIQVSRFPRDQFISAEQNIRPKPNTWIQKSMLSYTKNASPLRGSAVVLIGVLAVKDRLLTASAVDVIHGKLLRHRTKYGTCSYSTGTAESQHAADDVTL